MEVRNRFIKGLDLIDRVPDELWNEVRNIVQETGIKTIPMEKKCKKAKWLSAKSEKRRSQTQYIKKRKKKRRRSMVQMKEQTRNRQDQLNKE